MIVRYNEKNFAENTIMSSEIGKYVCAYTDFGFKRLFFSEPNKDVLISFLNSFLNLKDKIVDMSYLPLEQLCVLPYDKNAVIGVCCKNSAGSYVLVEIQNALPVFIKARSIFHSMSFIGNLAPQGVFDNKIKAVYTITLLGCTLDDDSKSYLHEVVLYDKAVKKQFYDKLAYYYLELPKFNKNADELETVQDKWMFAIKNLSALNDKPVALKEQVFTRLFRIAEIAKFSEKEKYAYEESLKKMWDNYATLESSFTEGQKKGKEEGLKQGKEEGLKQGLEKGLKQGIEKGLKQGIEEGSKQAQVNIAIKMKNKGMSSEDILNLTDLKEGQY